MNRNTLITAAVTAAITLIVTLGLSWGFGVFSAGQTAIDEEHIEKVVARMLVTDSGSTHAAKLHSIDVSLASINTNIGAIRDDVDDLENAVRALASE